MAIHLTPTELAREAGMERREVIEKCMEMGVPIFQGRIDKTLFMANVAEQAGSAESAGSGSLTRPAPARRPQLESPSSGVSEEERMECTSTAAAAPSSTGSTTIADIVGLAAERYGEHTAVRYKRDGDWRRRLLPRARRRSCPRSPAG